MNSLVDDACPSADALARYVRVGDDPGARAAMEAHLDRCPLCLATVAALARVPITEPSRPSHDQPTEGEGEPDSRSLALLDAAERDRLAIGTQLGRYRITGALGRGGMGSVYAAWDPELDRNVAIKVVRGPNHAAPERVASLRREAQALARLAHPHVVAIHDIGEAEGRVFMAMEQVEGLTLGEWLHVAPRTWRVIVELFVAIGEGLAAAHAVGIVHRDVKPSNILIAADGRARIGDFGLAAELGPEAAAIGIAGTPDYMAPEQLAGAAIDGRSDQYGFCVALQEALTGRRGADDPLDSLPPWLAALIQRGRARAPEQRFPDMRTLIAGLERGLGRRRRGLIAGAFVLAVAAGVAIAPRGDASSPSCRAVASELGRDATLRADLARLGRVAALDSAPALRAWSEVPLALASWRATWIAEREAACEASEREDPSPLDEQRRDCLERARWAHDALLELHDDEAQFDADLALRGPELVAALPDPIACRGGAGTSEALPGDAEGLAEYARIQGRLAHVDAMYTAARTQALGDLPAELERDAERLGHRPTLARARLARARVAFDLGELDEARAALERAVLAGEAGGDDELVVRAHIEAVWVVGYQLLQFDEGRRHAEHAAALLHRIGDPPELEAQRLRHVGWLEFVAGRLDEAERAFDGSLALIDDPWKRAMVLNGLASVKKGRGEFEAARAIFEQTREILEARLGADHPDVAKVRNNLAAVAWELGDLDEANRQFDAARRSFERAYGPTNMLVGLVGLNMTILALDGGHTTRALELADRSRAILEPQLGVDHPHVLQIRGLRAQALLGEDRIDEAALDLERLYATTRTELGPDHPEFGERARDLAELASARGDFARAATYMAEAEAAFVATYPVENPLRSEAHCDRARALRRAGDLAGARARLEEFERERPDQLDHADLWLEWLEQAIAEADPARGRAWLDRLGEGTSLGEDAERRVRLELARMRLAERPEAIASARASAEAWLAKLPAWPARSLRAELDSIVRP
ncbi:protein kinase domain-containing protein [Nannocystaceae bacterium ST9]